MINWEHDTKTRQFPSSRVCLCTIVWLVVGEERSCQPVDCFAQLSRVVEVCSARRFRQDKTRGGEPAGQVGRVAQTLHGCAVSVAERRQQVEGSVPGDEPKREIRRLVDGPTHVQLLYQPVTL